MHTVNCLHTRKALHKGDTTLNLLWRLYFMWHLRALRILGGKECFTLKDVIPKLLDFWCSWNQKNTLKCQEVLYTFSSKKYLHFFMQRPSSLSCLWVLNMQLFVKLLGCTNVPTFFFFKVQAYVLCQTHKGEFFYSFAKIKH